MNGATNRQKVLISGGGGGIGRACALSFAREGAVVAVGDIACEQGEATAAAVRDAGGVAIFVPLDVTSERDWAAAVSDAEQAFDGLTTLLNVAGIAIMGGIHTTAVNEWNRSIEVNQTGVFLGMRAAAEAFIRQGEGAIVNISSIFGLFATPFFVSYHSSKAAVRLLSKAAALEFAGAGIRVNTIFPGRILTPILSQGLSKEAFEATTCDIEQQIPMRRTGDPGDIAAGAVYLSSDEAKYVTGAELTIDGGWAAGRAY